jgi:hypothetical protein
MAWTERFVDASASGGGTGTSAADPWTLAEAVSNSAAGMRVNFKAGTYSLSGANTVTVSTTTDSPLYWRGYKTTLGDLDGKITGSVVDGTDIPYITQNDNLTLNLSYLILSGISFSQSSSNKSALFPLGLYHVIRNCRFRNTSSSATANLVDNGARDFQVFDSCEFSIAGTSTAALLRGDLNHVFTSCIFRSDVVQSASGVDGTTLVRNGTFQKCLFKNLSRAIVFSSSGQGNVFDCTFDNIADDAITIYKTTQGGIVTGNYFSNVTGFCIGNATGTATTDANGTFLIARNVYRGVGGQIENTVENTQYNALADASDLFTDSASGDYSLTSLSAGYGYGSSAYWGIGSTDYSDIGAIQHADPASGGGATIHPLYAN